MTELRKRMIESLQLRGLSERTQEACVRAVRQLADHYHKSSDLISEEELRQYFLHIKNVKKYSRAASTTAIHAIKFFYEKTLGREFKTFELVHGCRVPSAVSRLRGFGLVRQVVEQQLRVTQAPKLWAHIHSFDLPIRLMVSSTSGSARWTKSRT